MGQRILIDTNAAIDYLVGRLPQNGAALIGQLINTKQANISIIVQIELLSYNPPNPNDLRMVEDFVQKCNILPLTDEIAKRTYLLRRQRRRKLPDSVIAATALEHQMELLTHNISDFNNINGLTVIDPHTI